VKWFARRDARSEAHRQRAWELFRAGDHKGARALFQQWCDLEPESATAWFGYGWTSFAVLASEGMLGTEVFKTCSEMFKRAIQFNKQTFELTQDQLSAAHCQLGWALEASGDINGSRSHFEAAVKYAPNSDLAVAARKRLAAFAINQGDLVTAVDLLEKAAQINPTDQELIDNLTEAKRRRDGIEIVFRMFVPPPGLFTAVWVHPDETLGDIAARVLRDHGLQYEGGTFVYAGDDALPYYLDHGFREPHATVRSLGMKERDSLLYMQLVEAPGTGWTDSFDIKIVREHLQKKRIALARREIRRVMNTIEREVQDEQLERAETRLKALIQIDPDNLDALKLQDRVRAAISQRDLGSESSLEGTWPQSHGSGSRTNQSAIGPSPPLEVRWDFSACGSRLTSPVVAADALYVASWDQHLYCLDSKTGKERWRWQARTIVEQPPVVYRERVFVIDRDAVYCLDGHTGGLLWQRDGVQPQSAVLLGDRLYVADLAGTLRCIACETGRELSRLATRERALRSIAARECRITAASTRVLLTVDSDLNRVLWKREGRFDDAMPVLANNSIYMGTFNEGLWCLHEDTGRLQWIFGNEVPIRAAPAAARGRVFFCDTGGRFGCVDAYTGEMLWSPRTWTNNKVGCCSAPVVAGQWVYVLLDDGVLYCLDALTGTEWWRYTVAQWKAGVKSLAVTSTRLFCASLDGHLRSLSSPALRKSPVGESIRTSPPPARSNIPPPNTSKPASKTSVGFRDFGRPISLSRREIDDLHLAGYYLTVDRLDEGIAILSKLQRNHPDEGVVLHNLGNAYEWQGQVGDALATFDHILALYPDDIHAFASLGRILRTHPDIVRDIYGQPVPAAVRTDSILPTPLEQGLTQMIVARQAVLCCQVDSQMVALLGSAPAWFWWQLNELPIYPVLRLYLEFDYQPYRSKDLIAALDVSNAQTQEWLTLLETQQVIQVHIFDSTSGSALTRALNFSEDQRDRLRRLKGRALAYLLAIPMNRRDFQAARAQAEELWKAEGRPPDPAKAGQ
jgi:outer membrane protein assembly factor BamB/Flp pilus assembly protein TadD